MTSVRMRSIRFSMVMIAAVLMSSCSEFLKESDPDDCGYSAYYDASAANDQNELIFSRVTAEVLGGQRNCGFSYVRTQVSQAEVDGITLPEQRRGQDYFYIAPKGFDPRRNTVRIRMGDRLYVSDPNSVKSSDRNVNIALKLVDR